MEDLGIIICEEILIESIISDKIKNIIKNIKKKLADKLRAANVDIKKTHEMANQITKELRPLAKEYKKMGPAGGKKLGQEILKRSQAAVAKNKNNLIKESNDGVGKNEVIGFVAAVIAASLLYGGAPIPLILVPGVITVIFGHKAGLILSGSRRTPSWHEA